MRSMGDCRDMVRRGLFDADARWKKSAVTRAVCVWRTHEEKPPIMKAYDVVAGFEVRVAEYAGAKYAVAARRRCFYP